MTRYTILGLLAALCLILVPGCQQQATVSKSDIEAAIKENPEIVMEILREHSEEVFEIAQDGVNIKRKRAMHETWEYQLDNPKTAVVDPERPIRGQVDAPVTIVEYSDFLCPYCARAAQTIEETLEQYKGTVRLQFKHLTLPTHENSMIAAQYFEAASLQDPAKAWELHDIFYDDQGGLDQGGEDWIKEQAASIGGLDLDLLQADAHSEKILQRIYDDGAEADANGFNGTPSFLVNGVEIQGNPDPADLNDLIELVLKKTQ